nr:DUF4185 domain-containing protein [Gordonia soli]
MIGRILLCGGLAAASGVAVTLGSGAASAAPCGNGGTGSSLFGSAGLPGSSGALGSLGSGSSGSRSTQVPQGSLPVYAGVASKAVAWVTGPRSQNSTYNRFGISGTDLGISWDNGSGQTLMAFGDTFGNCAVAGQEWRHNVLLRTSDTDLDNGILVRDGVPGDVRSGSVVSADRPRFAQELIPSLGISNIEVTTIPTAAIAVPGPNGTRQIINYMSVRSWGAAGRWVTNFSGIAYSDNNGQSWNTDISTVLVNAPLTLALPDGLPKVDRNNGKFQQSAYVRGRADDAADRDYVYQFGTPNGRFGAGFLGRVPESKILDLDAYQYWAGSGRGWVDDIGQIPDDGTAIVVPAPVTELSVSWSPYLKKYVMLDGDVGIRIRTADHPQGPWSRPTYIVPPGAAVLYGPMVLPTSPALTGTGKELYFNASRWSDYNVMLIRTDLSRVPGLR